MIVASRFPSKIIVTATTLVALGLMAGACADRTKTIPTWGGSTPPVATGPSTVYTPSPVQSQPEPALSSNGRFTFTQGCTGNFSVRDTRTNRQISNGRAYNSGSGLIALDAQGRRTRAVSSATSQSVIFLPDCNCRLGGNQSGDLPSTHQYAAKAPSAASCSAG